MIKLQDISFQYDKVVFENINLNIDKDHVTFIVGKNGSGKSTLANLISGLLFPKSGKIYLDDIELNKKTNNKIVREKVGIVFQNPSNQILFSKVDDDIKFTLENMKVSKEKIPERIKDSLKKVDMLEYIEANPYNLSGGQKQRIAIASQLSLNPDYLIFDEATSMLDINGKKDIYKLIKTLKRNMGIICISNDISELIYADDIIIIDNHKLYKYTLTEILKENDILTKHGLNVPFIFTVASALHITDTKKLTENYIIKRIGNN